MKTIADDAVAQLDSRIGGFWLLTNFHRLDSTAKKNWVHEVDLGHVCYMPGSVVYMDLARADVAHAAGFTSGLWT